MASCRKDSSIWVSPKDSAILFRSTIIYVRPSFDVFGHTNISTMRETFRIGKLGFLMGTFLFLKSSIILLAFFFYFSICFHVSTNNLIMAIILFEKKMPCKSWCQPFNLGAHHYFDFKGHGSCVGFLAANFGDVDMTSSTILNSRAIQWKIYNLKLH